MSTGPGKWASAARTVIRGILPNTWFGPLQPMQPFAGPGTAGRQWDYPVGANIMLQTRPSNMLSFATLRRLAETCDILRLCIETRKDQIEGLEWQIVPRDPKGNAEDPRIKEIEQFFRRPDRKNDWPTWLRALLEDMFVIDAMTIYKRRNMIGGLYSLELMDGALIKVLIDDHGRVPEYPDPSFQHILKGQPAVDYDSTEMLYQPRNIRTWSVYGYSPVEQILITVETLLNRARFVSNYYSDGNQPDSIMTLPEEMTVEEVKAFQTHWDSLLSGNLATRRGMKFIPGGRGSKYQEIKEPPMKDEFDEWLARICCNAFSLPPTAFTNQNNRATAETAQDTAMEEGLAPICRWITSWMNRLLEDEFDAADFMFSFKQKDEQDQTEAATIRQGDVKAGIISIDEARESIGLDPVGGVAAELGIVGAGGFMPLELAVEQANATHEATINAINNPQPMPGEEPKDDKDDKNLKKQAQKKTLYR